MRTYRINSKDHGDIIRQHRIHKYMQMTEKQRKKRHKKPCNLNIDLHICNIKNENIQRCQRKETGYDRLWIELKKNQVSHCHDENNQRYIEACDIFYIKKYACLKTYCDSRSCQYKKPKYYIKILIDFNAVSFKKLIIFASRSFIKLNFLSGFHRHPFQNTVTGHP